MCVIVVPVLLASPILYQWEVFAYASQDISRQMVNVSSAMTLYQSAMLKVSSLAYPTL
jgi:hypothetical protein